MASWILHITGFTDTHGSIFINNCYKFFGKADAERKWSTIHLTILPLSLLNFIPVDSDSSDESSNAHSDCISGLSRWKRGNFIKFFMKLISELGINQCAQLYSAECSQQRGKVLDSFMVTSFSCSEVPYHKTISWGPLTSLLGTPCPCISICTYKLQEGKVHLWGFSPVWIFMCL